jgi:large subunit ribosomal protein L29
MKGSDIKNMTADEIEARIEELEEEIFRLKFRHGNQGVDNPLRLRYMHRDVARLKTALSENKLGIYKLPQ